LEFRDKREKEKIRESIEKEKKKKEAFKVLKDVREREG
jgi:hypothetical protein